MPKRLNPITIKFGGHSDGDSFWGRKRKPSKGVKTVVFEAGWGMQEDSTLRTLDWHLPNFFDSYSVQAKRYLRNALKKGARVAAGERLRAPEEIQKWDRFREVMFDRQDVFARERTLENFKKSTDAYCNLAVFRNKLIQREILLAAKEGKVEARYGIAHSLMGVRLKRLGADVKREVEPSMFNWFEVILRKAEHGIKVTEKDYKRGFLQGQLRRVLGRELSSLEEVCERVMIGNLSEPQLDEIISNPDLIRDKLLGFNKIDTSKLNSKQEWNARLRRFLGRYPVAVKELEDLERKRFAPLKTKARKLLQKITFKKSKSRFPQTEE